ncbi:MAG: o-succinylbenzoate synthase [Acidobacteria bacterium]|nr:o-succinylbenzoate synthase [Acidobacteriota bacterium]
MKIESITIRELSMSLKAPYETSAGTEWDRRVLLVQVMSEGLCGWGEVTVDQTPSFTSETTDTAWHILSDFLVPMILGKTVSGGEEAGRLMHSVRGHEMARAALENAIWDIEAQRNGLPLGVQLGGTLCEIPCGAALGIQQNLDTLLNKVRDDVEAGYQRVKLKIKPGHDIQVIRQVRRAFPDINLMVDCNSSYLLAHAALFQALDDFGLMMIEQPLWWDGILDHAKLQAQLRTPICLDESVRNAHLAQEAIEMKACKIMNIKLGRVGGHSTARKVHDLCVEANMPAWCGGMLESGIGRAHNIAMSTLPGFVLPGDVSASQRYWDEDIIEPEVEVTSRGTIDVPRSAGLGYTVRQELVEKLTVRHRQWKSSLQSSIGAVGAVVS